MKITQWLPLGAAITVALASPVSAATVVDQSQTAYIGPWQAINLANARYSQSFKAGYNNSVGGGFYLTDTYGQASGVVTVSLYTQAIGAAGSTLLASGSATGNAGSWIDVSWTQIALTVGTTYYLGLTSASALYVGYGNNTYSGGNVYNYTSATAQGAYDLSFRTFANNAVVVPPVTVAAVPEPATWATMLLGFGMIAGTARYRRRSVRVVYA